MERLYDFFGIYVVPCGFYMSLFVLIRISSIDVSRFQVEMESRLGGRAGGEGCGGKLATIRGLDIQQ